MKTKIESQTSATVNASKFVFRKYDTIGDPSAESDLNYLSSCFVNNGELLDILRDCSDQRGIVLGRTGTGKTALLKMLARTEEREIVLSPHDLALGYISNSAVLTFFAALDVKMGLFYRALWRHVIVSELLKRYFKFSPETERIDPWEHLRLKVQRKRAHLAALKYLKDYAGSEFWNTTEDLIKEITVKVETALKAKVDVSLHKFISLGADGVQQLSAEQRREIHQIGQEVVNRTQMSELSEIMKALNETILVDNQKRYFVLVDQLDEDWVDDTARYRLLRALIETMREINSTVSTAKVVIALRTDLLERIFAATTDAGFQGEKYRALCLSVSWTEGALQEVLDRRINQLVRNRYSSHNQVTHRDVLPDTVHSGSGLDYLLDRTLMRPRDAIAFVNACVAHAEGEPVVSKQQVLDAEVEYSRGRLESLADEWSVHYPNFIALCGLLKGRQDHFKLYEIGSDELISLCSEVLEADEPKIGEDFKLLDALADCRIGTESLKAAIAHILWRAGAVGLKTAPYQSVNWSHISREQVLLGEIGETTTVYVHKMLWRTLGIKPC